MKLRYRLGKYILNQRIEQKTISSTWHALDSNTGQELVIKLFDSRLSPLSEIFHGFVEHVKKIELFRHTNILSVLDSGQVASFYYLTMPYMSGGPFSQVMMHFDSMRELQAQNMIAHIANSLEFAHNEGVLHLNLHPDNLFLNNQFMPLISDFGLANLIGERNMSYAAYQAPEIWQAGKPGFYTDVYSLGALSYQLLTGRPAFPTTNINQLREQQLEQIIIFPANLSRKWQSFIRQCMHQNPTARYQNMAEVLESLYAEEYYQVHLPPINELNPSLQSVFEEANYQDFDAIEGANHGDINIYSSDANLAQARESVLGDFPFGHTESYQETDAAGSAYLEGTVWDDWQDEKTFDEEALSTPTRVQRKRGNLLMYILIGLVLVLAGTIVYLLSGSAKKSLTPGRTTPISKESTPLVSNELIGPNSTPESKLTEAIVRTTPTIISSYTPTTTPSPTPIVEAKVEFEYYHDPEKLQVINENNLDSLTEIVKMSFPKDYGVRDYKFSPDDNYLAVLNDNELSFFSGQNFAHIIDIVIDNQRSIRWSEDSRQLITMGSGKIHLFDVGSDIKLKNTFSTDYKDLDWSANGKFIVIRTDSEIKLLNTDTFEISILSGYNDEYLYIAISSDGKEVAATHRVNPEVVIWSTETRNKTRTITHPPSDCSGGTSVGKFGFIWMKNDQWMAISDCYSEVHVIDAKAGQWLKDDNSGGGRFSPYFSVSPDHSYLVGSYQGMYSNFCLWNTNTWNRVLAFDWYANTYCGFIWSPDSNYVLISVEGSSPVGYGSLPSGYFLIDASTGNYKQVMNERLALYSWPETWSRDGKRIIVSGDGIVVLGIPEN